MRPSFLFLLCFFISHSSVASDKLQASFDLCRFYSPQHGNYIETYLSISGPSLKYVKTSDQGFQGKVEMKLTFKKNGSVFKTQRYLIESPVIKDTSTIKPDFITQERILLDTGNYELELDITDVNIPDEHFNAGRSLEIPFIGNTLSISDIQQFDSLIESSENNALAKSGYEFIPYSSDFYPEYEEKVGFYFEIYNSDKVLEEKTDYLITYFIEGYESKEVIGNYKGFVKKTAQPVNAVASRFYIKDLPSGNYNLVIEVRDRNNDLLKDQRLFFMRSNPGIASYIPEETAGTFVDKITDPDSLAEYISMLEPISDRLEVEFVENQLQDGNLELMQQYFLNFWIKRQAENPEDAWFRYYQQVLRVNINYSTKIQKGYLTDRGFRYLQYGPPDNIDKRYFEPSTYPYEIWQYYKLRGQANRRFIFWSPYSVTNDFELLHSDMIGEVKNPQWRYKLTVGNAAVPANPEITRPRVNTFGSDPLQNDIRDRR